MRIVVTHFVNQVSSAHKYTRLKPFQNPRPLFKSSIRLPESLNIPRFPGLTGFLSNMSSRQNNATSLNRTVEPLALPGGAPLKVKNSLSKEKVSQTSHHSVEFCRKFSNQRRKMKFHGILADRVHPIFKNPYWYYSCIWFKSSRSRQVSFIVESVYADLEIMSPWI